MSGEINPGSNDRNDQIRALIRKHLAEVRGGSFDGVAGQELASIEIQDPVLEAERMIPIAMATSHEQGHEIALELLENVNRSLAQLAAIQRPTGLEPDPELSWIRLNYTGMMMIGLGRDREAQARLGEGLDLTLSWGRAEWSAGLLVTRARSFLQEGRTLDAARDLAKITSLDLSSVYVGIANSQLADLFESFGQMQQAKDYRSRSLDWVRNPDPVAANPFQKFMILSPLMLSEIEWGDLDGAAITRDACDQLVGATGSDLLRSILEHLEALLLIRSGNAEDGLELLDQQPLALAASGHLVGNLCVPLVRAEGLLLLGKFEACLAVVDCSNDGRTTTAHLDRLLSLAVSACKKAGDWERVAHYQQQLVDVIQDRRIESRELLALHQMHKRSRAQQQLNTALATSQKTLEFVRTDYDTLLDVVTHDVMSPLSSLKLLLVLSEEAEQGGNANAQRFEATLGRVGRIVERLAVLGDTVAGETKQRAGSDVRVGLDQLVSSIVDEYQPLAQQKHINLRFTNDLAGLETAVEELSDAVVADAVVHILQNLVSNAIKFSEVEGVVAVKIARSLGRRRDDGQVSILVIDEGPGMSNTDLSRLFARYGRLSAQPTAGESSTGLGLYIAERFAKSIGAELSASSGGHGRGTTFRLDLARS